MANAANYAPHQDNKAGAKSPLSSAASALTTLLRDIGAGALSTSKLVVMTSGCAGLLAAGVLVGSEDARALLAARLPVPHSVAIVPDAEAPPDSTSRDQRVQVNTDDPQQKRIVQYLARRYRVADGAARLLVSAAFQIGKEKNLDPLLILSVVAIESSLNPFAQSAMGAQGLMQVMTRVHAQRFEPHGGETAALDPIANMEVGSSILHELISRGGSVERGLQLYVGAGNMPDDGGYGVRVLGERARLRLAATGKVDAAIASAIRAAATPAAESKPAAMPVNAEVSVPLEPTLKLAPPSSTSDSQHLQTNAGQSV